jgi:hypothetical protein
MSTTFDVISPDTDRETAVSDLAAAKPGDPEARLAFARQRLSVAFLAADLGHAVTWDPPWGITSIQSRWTCTSCGRAILQRTSMDDPYGSAITDGPCPGKES